jgi:hypothetical protein
MSMKDKLEIGLKPDAPYRPDNLPEHQQDDADCVEAAEPGHGAAQERAREDCTTPAPALEGGPHAEPDTDERD